MTQNLVYTDIKIFHKNSVCDIIVNCIKCIFCQLAMGNINSAISFNVTSAL